MTVSRVALVVVLLMSWTARADHTYHELALDDGKTLRYAVVLPDDFDAARTYPVLLALPPGPQTERMVEAGLSRYWGTQAAERGWIVISPVAPEGTSFYQGAETTLPALLDHVSSTHHIEGGRFHLAGASNGGRSAFRVAGLYTDRFQSMTVLPGFPPTAADRAGLDRLRRLPIWMFVGGDDERWVEQGEQARDDLRRLGADVRFTILPGEGHVPRSLDGDVIMNHLERARSIAAVNMVLDDFHDAAADADGGRYFAHFAADAVFIGTDPGERWTRTEFEAFARPYFDRGTGWTYEPRTRHVDVTPDGATVWFDEMLVSEKYGDCRGTGVLICTTSGWKISQYVLTIPIPNDLAVEFVERMREGGG